MRRGVPWPRARAGWRTARAGLGRDRSRRRSATRAPRRRPRGGRRRERPGGAPAADRRRRPPRPAVRRLLDGLLEAGAGGEARDLAGGDGHRLARARVATLAGAAAGDVELAEARERDLFSTLERALDRAEDGVHGASCILLAQAALLSDLINEVRLRHDSSLCPLDGIDSARS